MVYHEFLRGLGCQRGNVIDCDVSRESDHGLVSRIFQPTRFKPRTFWMICLAMIANRNFKRFSIRVLLVATLLAALPAWWVASKRSEFAHETRIVAQLKETHPDLVVRRMPAGPAWLSRLGYSPPWLERVWGLDATGVVYGGKPVPLPLPMDFDDADLKEMMPRIRELSYLKKLYLPFTNITDKSLPELATLHQLDFLNLQQTGMTSDGVRKLENNLPNAEIKFFSRC